MNSSTTDLTCRELVVLVTEYLERTLPDAERARFEAHLDGCPYCRIYLEQMRQTIQLLGRVTEDELAPEAKVALLQRFRDWKAEPS